MYLYNSNSVQVDVDHARTSSIIVFDPVTIVSMPLLVFCLTVVDAVYILYGYGLVGSILPLRKQASSGEKLGENRPSLYSTGISDLGNDGIIILILLGFLKTFDMQLLQHR